MQYHKLFFSFEQKDKQIHKGFKKSSNRENYKEEKFRVKEFVKKVVIVSYTIVLAIKTSSTVGLY